MRPANLIVQVNNWYLLPAFQALIEDHLPSIRLRRDTHVKVVDSGVARHYVGDYYGLLTELGIHDNLHYIVMRLNDRVSTFDYDGSLDPILVPDENYISRLVNSFSTTSKLTEV